MLIYLLVTGIIGMTGGMFISIKEFFLHTTWGIIALICGVVSAVLFYASSKMPKQMRESKSRVKAITPALKMSSQQNSFSQNKSMNQNNDDLQDYSQNRGIQEHEIDMSSMSLEGFFREVAFTMNKPAPVIFKAWGNRRFRLDVERVNILGSYIQSVRGTCDSYLQLRADMFFAEKKFEHFVSVNAANAKNNLDLVEEQYKDVKWNMDYNRRLKEADLKDREIAQKEKLSKIEEQDQRNAFFTMAIKDYPEMPAPLKAYMFTQVHGRYPEAKRDFEIEEKISDFIMKKYDYDIQNMDYETKKKREEAKTYVEKMKHERNKKYD